MTLETCLQQTHLILFIYFGAINSGKFTFHENQNNPMYALKAIISSALTST